MKAEIRREGKHYTWKNVKICHATHRLVCDWLNIHSEVILITLIAAISFITYLSDFSLINIGKTNK